MYLQVGLSVCCQLLLYVLLRKHKYARIVCLFLFLLLHMFVLPKLATEAFFAGLETETPRCGMPAIGIYFFFWVVGGGLTLTTHICYWLINRSMSRKERDLQHTAD